MPARLRRWATTTLQPALTKQQRSKAILGEELPPDVFTSAYRDNFEMRYEGVRFDDFASGQQTLLLDLASTYVNRMHPSYASVKMEEVRRQLEGWFIFALFNSY